ncbi:hypothetical protein HZS_3748 [Henneguya salminicola]|nr:hypothetical protein HZS_3748 [Henneguya salminicola]
MFYPEAKRYFCDIIICAEYFWSELESSQRKSLNSTGLFSTMTSYKCLEFSLLAEYSYQNESIFVTM